MAQNLALRGLGKLCVLVFGVFPFVLEVFSHFCQEKLTTFDLGNKGQSEVWWLTLKAE